MVDHLNLKKEQELKLEKFLLNSGLNHEEIRKIINDDYRYYEDLNDITFFSEFAKYNNIIQELANDYTLEQIALQQNISTANIKAFKKLLEQNNLNINIVKAFNRYSNGSNMILAIKRGVSPQKILENIKRNFIMRMTNYKIPDKTILEIKKYIETLDFTLPLYQNYELTKKFLQNYNLVNKYMVAILSLVNKLNSYYHIEETISNLDVGLKCSLSKSIKLYRAIKPSFFTQNIIKNGNYLDLIGHKIEESGYTSTSPIYDRSFAKYDDYSIVLEIFAPQGTQGLLITPFSSYGDAEQEVLLNTNDLFIFDVIPNVIDKNGKIKIICKSLVLSKDKIGYKGLSLGKSR